MFMQDRLTLDAPRRTKDGYMVVRARAARTGVYEYAGREVDPDNKHGLRDRASVNVLRDEQTVFDAAAVRSFIGKPVTDDHPKEAITAQNWRDHARGTIMGALRDGDYLAFDLLLTDAGTVAKVDGGKRELSNGYTAELEFGTFKAADGTECQARQAKITDGNHVALVDFGRAGSDCSIRDRFAVCDTIPADFLANFLNDTSDTNGDPTMKTLTIDGLKVPNVSDEAEAAILKLQGQITDAQTKLGTATADLVTANTTIQTKDGEIAALTVKLKDAEVTPARLQELADARAKVIADAQKIASGLVVDGKTDAEIKRAAVTAKLGDAAKDMADAAIDGAFLAFAKDGGTGIPDPLRTAIADGATNVPDARAMRDHVRANRYN